eukprot:c34664_g1_i1.p2 GENE.c34664_g1_i1~~c34664_g1_i1.p2  ORF type:complete len:157 (-),score=22.94 c34664_g1_i1:261-731(-)
MIVPTHAVRKQQARYFREGLLVKSTKIVDQLIKEFAWMGNAFATLAGPAEHARSQRRNMSTRRRVPQLSSALDPSFKVAEHASQAWIVLSIMAHVLRASAIVIGAEPVPSVKKSAATPATSRTPVTIPAGASSIRLGIPFLLGLVRALQPTIAIVV